MLDRLYRYAAPYCRLRAMKADLLGNEDYGSLLSAPDLERIRDYLLHTVYGAALPDEAHTSVVDMQRALREGVIRSCEKLLRLMRGASSEYVRTLIGYFDLLNVKTVIRGLGSLESEEWNVAPLLFDTGRWGLCRKKELAGVSDFPSLGALLLPTFLSSGYATALYQYQIDGDVSSFESALELGYFDYLWKQTANLRGLDRSYGGEILRTYGYTKNVIWFLRLRFLRQMEVHSIANYLLPFDGASARSPFTEALSIEGEQEAFAFLVDRLLPDFQREHGERIDPFSFQRAEWVLMRYFLERCRRVLRGPPFQMGAFLAYYFLKQAEVQDLITLTEGKSLGLTAERISRLLVSQSF